MASNPTDSHLHLLHAVPPAASQGQSDRGGPSYMVVLAKAALAGGLASSASVLALHPIDTLKTRVQSTPGATIRGIAASAPKIGVRGLYRGIIPAVGGAPLSSLSIIRLRRRCAAHAAVYEQARLSAACLACLP